MEHQYRFRFSRIDHGRIKLPSLLVPPQPTSSHFLFVLNYRWSPILGSARAEHKRAILRVA
jgi:hypothetical protein